MLKQEKYERFSEILRHTLTKEQFAKFVIDWFDGDMLCEMIEDDFFCTDKEQQDEWFDLIKSYLNK